MAKLINCADCKKKVSINANTCPSCGSPIQNQPNVQKQRLIEEEAARRKSEGKGVFIYIAVVVLVLIGLSSFSRSIPSALFILLGAALLAPELNQFISEKKPVLNRKLLKIVGVVLVISGFVIMSSAMDAKREQYLQENPEEAARIQKEQVEAAAAKQIEEEKAAAEAKKNPTRHGMDKIYYQVAQDTVDQYNIAKNQGDAMQICVQAGLVSAAYLQAKDQEKYDEWKSIEKSDCRVAGL